jgi:sugar/nucleoside kinase (ribokinase family)
VCFPNRDEAAVLTGEPDPVTMAVRLTRHYGAVVLKLGDQGALLAVPGRAPVRVPAYPAQATDTTGAGDAFCGAFMSRWLSSNLRTSTDSTDPTDSRDPTDSQSPSDLDALMALEVADLAGAAQYAVRIAAAVVTRFGGRPV